MSEGFIKKVRGRRGESVISESSNKSEYKEGLAEGREEREEREGEREGRGMVTVFWLM